jgi:hypothetical protein
MTNQPNLGANYCFSLVVTIGFVIVFFEVMPERTIWSVSIEPEDLAVPGLGGYPLLLIEKQDQVPGEKRDDEIVTNFPEAAAMGRILMHAGFPGDKNKIIQFVQKQQESNPECRFDCKEILPLLQKIEERDYENAFEVTRVAGLVRLIR